VRGTLLSTVLHRIEQVARSFDTSGQSQCLRFAEAHLEPHLLPLFASMQPPDQRHGCRVAAAMLQTGWNSPDALAAALLHDAGKSVPGGRVTLPDRVMVVLLRAIAPGLLGRIGGVSGSGIGAALRHAETGAAMLRDAGASPYLVWLVAHHHRREIVDDPLLCSFFAADDAS
jgi:hypothetical protein